MSNGLVGWFIVALCEHCVCDYESVTCGVQVATLTLAWCALCETVVDLTIELLLLPS